MLPLFNHYANLITLILEPWSKWFPYRFYEVLHPVYLGRTGVKLRQTKGKINENTVYARFLLNLCTDMHNTRGKGMISQISNQVNKNASYPVARDHAITSLADCQIVVLPVFFCKVNTLEYIEGSAQHCLISIFDQNDIIYQLSYL